MKTNNYLVTMMLIVLSSAAGLCAGTNTAAVDECAVCRIQRLDYQRKTIVARSRFKGQDYLFCSDSCKSQFDINPDFFVDPPLPRPAPDFELVTLGGEKDSLANYRGEVVLIDFWASWCAPCIKTMRDLESLFREFQADSLKIVGITLDSIGHPPTKSHVERNMITYPILFDDRTGPTWLAYQVKSLPSLYLVNRQGQIVRQWRGASTRSEVAAAIRSLLND